MLGPPTAQGRWSLAVRDLRLGAAPDDAAFATLSVHARAAALLGRYGVLTREAVRGEGVPGGFASVYPVLRAMEESGRIRRGYFVAGLGGAQFALPGAVDRLRTFREGEGSAVRGGSAVMLAATDPANPYGVSLAWPEGDAEGGTQRRPQRVAGAYVVLVDGLASLYLERGGRGLVALRPRDGTWERAAVSALVGLLQDGRLNKLVLDRFPDDLAEVLRELSFVPTPKGLARYA